jgi:hypothetical protein
MAVVDWRVAAPFVHRRAWLLALFLGLAIAVAATARVEGGPIFLTGNGALLTGNGALLTAGQRCELKAGPFRMELPAWVNRFMPW